MSVVLKYISISNMLKIH